MTYDDVEILTDQEVKGIYNDVYNSFWLRYGSRSWNRRNGCGKSTETVRWLCTRSRT